MGKRVSTRARWRGAARRRGPVAAFARGLARALDRRATTRLLDASFACAELADSLRRALSIGPSDRSGLGAAIAEMRALRGRAAGPEERFVVECALHALGEEDEPPVLPEEPLAARSWRWRQTRRRLRRFGARLRSGAALGALEVDSLSEVGALLDRMRQDRWAGVGWPNSWALARVERVKLGLALPAAEGAEGARRL